MKADSPGHPKESDKTQIEIGERNKSRIENYIKNRPNVRRSEIIEATGLTSPTVYKHLKSLILEKKIIKNNKIYVSTKDYLIELGEKNIEDFKKSLSPIKITEYELINKYYDDSDYTIHERILDMKEKIGPFPTRVILEAETRLWSLGADIRIWNKGANYFENDHEIFETIQNLVKLLIRKSEIIKLKDSRMLIQIYFDLPTTINNLYKYVKTESSDFADTWYDLHLLAAIKIINEAQNPKGKPLGRKIVNVISRTIDAPYNAADLIIKAVKSKIDERDEDKDKSI